MRRLLLILLLTLATRADVRFSFELRGKETLRGVATVAADAPGRGPRLRLEAGGVLVWSDGETVDVIDSRRRTHTYSTYSRAGLALLAESTHGVADPFALTDWWKRYETYKPKDGGTSMIRGVKCNVKELRIGSRRWRWHFGAVDGLLRREERLSSKEMVDYFDVAYVRNKIGPRPAVPAGFTSREFRPAPPNTR
ncbi:MAG TPA: hypothetical protein VF824_06970 [Thermoanaerobaculia bacterium]|jgi:hypothetical protein